MVASRAIPLAPATRRTCGLPALPRLTPWLTPSLPAISTPPRALVDVLGRGPEFARSPAANGEHRPLQLVDRSADWMHAVPSAVDPALPNVRDSIVTR